VCFCFLLHGMRAARAEAAAGGRDLLSALDRSEANGSSGEQGGNESSAKNQPKRNSPEEGC